MPDKADPLQPGSTCFVFPICQVERKKTNGVLVVTLPGRDLTWRGARVEPDPPGISWTAPKPLGSAAEVVCDPCPEGRHDRAEYPQQPRYSEPKVAVSFRGPVSYGRIPRGDEWALAVHAAVRRGGPIADDWSQYDAVEFACTPPAPAVSAVSRPKRKTSASAKMLADAPLPPPPVTGPHDPYP
jgi:hypothetical protein